MNMLSEFLELYEQAKRKYKFIESKYPTEEEKNREIVRYLLVNGLIHPNLQ